jgi:hypothetical protein
MDRTMECHDSLSGQVMCALKEGDAQLQSIFQHFSFHCLYFKMQLLIRYT